MPRLEDLGATRCLLFLEVTVCALRLFVSLNTKAIAEVSQTSQERPTWVVRDESSRLWGGGVGGAMESLSVSRHRAESRTSSLPEHPKEGLSEELGRVVRLAGQIGRAHV